MPLCTIFTKCPAPDGRNAGSPLPRFRGLSRDRACAKYHRAPAQEIEDWIEMLDDLLLATDHLAIATLETPDTTARPYIRRSATIRAEFFRAANVIDVVRVAAVDYDVARFRAFPPAPSAWCPRRRQAHQPDGARDFSFFTRSSSEVAAVAPSRATSFTDSALRSKATHWCPARCSRRTMLAPILPSRSFRVASIFLLSARALSTGFPLYASAWLTAACNVASPLSRLCRDAREGRVSRARKYCEIAAGLRSLDDTERIFLVGDRNIDGVVTGDLQKTPVLGSALVGLARGVKKTGAETKNGG